MASVFIYPILVNSNSLQPAHFIDEIVLEKKPLVINEFADGNMQRIFTTKFTVPKILQLRYENLSSAKTKEFSLFWDLVEGTSNYWYFNPRFYLYPGKWQFIDAPIIDPIISRDAKGVFKIKFSIRKIGF